ncbi:MAG TPA: cation-translocating P-type ATPase [Candidatus Humimicrobiaceae bacterium]
MLLNIIFRGFAYFAFTIHIPIAFGSLLAPLLGISPASLLLLTLHVVLLELVIDQTCSIVLERQPAEKDIMQRPPRNPKEKLLTAAMLAKSVMQGLTIFGASFAMYYIFVNRYPDNAALARTMGLSIILLSNVLLVQVNSSSTEFAITSFMRQIKDKVMWAVIIGTISLLFDIFSSYYIPSFRTGKMVLLLLSTNFKLYGCKEIKM